MIRTDISSSSGSYVGSTEYGYDPRGIQTSIINSIGGKTYSQYYHYYQIKNANGVVVNDSLRNAMDGLPTRYIALGVNTDYTHDSLNRRQLTTVDLERDIVTDYNYKMSARTEGTYFTNQLASEEIDGVLYSYTYDKVGNITAIAKGGVTYRTYTYDALNQLLSETNHIDEIRTEYEYNHLGNIRFKKIYSTEDNKLQKQTEYKYYTDTDTGWWLDLTEIETIEYNSDGEATKTTKETVNYDTIGNPTTYRNATMSWFGRQLTNYSKGSTTASFTYDASGLRGTKTVNGTKTVYQYVGDKLFYEKRGKKQEFYYFYDSYGKLSSIYYHYDSDNNDLDSSAVYFVTTNSQGDVIGLYNNKGVKVAAYEYDAWGNILSVKDSTGETITNQDHIANANPFRYRGYYYDDDLKLYYLQSRYYDSTVGRFINADNLVSDVGGDVLGNNMFAYCLNNPVNMSDPSGHWSKWVERIGFIASCAFAVKATVATVTLLAIGAPAIAVGAATALLGIAVGGIIDGIGNAAQGDSYVNGCIGGYVGNGIEAIGEKLLGVSGGSVAGVIGNVAATGITSSLNNVDPYSKSLSSKEIKENLVSTAVVSGIAKLSSGVVFSGVDMANKNGSVMPGYTKGFGDALKVAFSVLDDAITIIWG